MSFDSLAVTPTPAGCRFEMRVIPRAPRTAIDGVRDGRLLVRVSAPPVDRAANDAAIALVADAAGLARANVAIVSGATSRNKLVALSGLSDAEWRRRLSAYTRRRS